MYILTTCFLLSILPVSPALAAGDDYPQAVLERCNVYHQGAALQLDLRLCAMAATLATEQDGRSSMTAYRPNGSRWNTVFDEYAYKTEPASSGCNWLRVIQKPSASEIVEYWMKTPGFEENVRSSMFTHTGIYVYYSQSSDCYYVVQLFTKPASAQDSSIPVPTELLAISTGRVNVRSGPGTSYSKLGRLKKGQTVARMVDLWELGRNYMDGKFERLCAY